MQFQPLPEEVERKIMSLKQQGRNGMEISRDLGIPKSTIYDVFKRNEMKPQFTQPLPPVEYLDKKVGGLNWRDTIAPIQAIQNLRKDASWTQKFATIKIGDGINPIAIMCLSDMHIGSIGADYSLFVELTDIILNTPHLYVAIIGDEVEWAIRLRGVAEVCAQVLDPAMQLEFIDSWLNEIAHKVLFATWSNHSTERSEQAAGACPVKNILAKKVPFFNGIGHAAVQVGQESYNIAASHKFKGVTQADCTAGCKRYLRQEWTEGEIAIQGDAHRAGVSIYNEGSRHGLVALCSGTLQVNSTFAARYFSLFTSTAFPIIELFPDEHMVIPYMTIGHYTKAHSVNTL